MKETLEERERHIIKLVAEVEEMREMVERSRGEEEQQLSKRQRKRKRRRESASLLSRMPEESDEGANVYQTFHGRDSVQEVSERQRTRSSSWGEKEFQLLGEKGRKKA